ncbi:MAG: ImuA family protein [Alphaproteobacteria bacterium]
MQNVHAPRTRVAAIMPPAVPENPIALGAPAIDAHLNGGLTRRALHEIYAAGTADAAAAAGFAAALASRAAGRRPLLWARLDALAAESGGMHGPGLADIGLAPDSLVLVRARTLPDLLKAGWEAARCAALGAVLIEAWGGGRALDLTASRRLLLAAQTSGAPTLLLRTGTQPMPSAAWTRWMVRAAPSQALAAGAPGHPAYDLTLLRHREGIAPRDWRVEWNRDQRCFREASRRRDAALPRPVVPLPADGEAAPDAGLRRAG